MPGHKKPLAGGRMKRSTIGRAIAMLAAIAAAGWAGAQTCDLRGPPIQFAREDLQRAANEGDLPTAQDYADRARREFDHLATSASRCGCRLATTKFEEAATQIRRTQEAESRKDLREVIARTRPLFEAALAELRECGRRSLQP